MMCSNLPIQRLQLISNRSRRESKPPPPSPLMTRNRRYKVDQREESCHLMLRLNYDANSEVSSVKASLFLGSEATGADVSVCLSLTIFLSRRRKSAGSISMARESRYLLNIIRCSPSRLFLVNVIVLRIQHHPWDSTDHPCCIHYLCHLICSYFCNWPFNINDCHKLKVSDVSLDKFDDQYFGKVAEKKTKKGEGEYDGAVDFIVFCYTSISSSPLYFFTCFLFLCVLPSSRVRTYTLQGLSEFSRQRERKCLHKGKNDQKAVDGALIKAIEVVSELNICLGTRFSLHKE
ncbi:hypothetical protein HID58_085984 [Brassica napus]|uniref:Uncharacterized protein n=1 Tax=Brassica napus TaxID=3708 RepID=A0ABQ7XP40_BRANA|nr:hypothetical protein HID58_085984 [Brassica napus]